MREWLKELRENSKMSQQNIADRLGITQNYYSMIELGTRMPKMTIEMAEKLSDALGVPLATILENERMLGQRKRGGIL